MNKKRILGIILLVVGFAMYLFSNYIEGQVTEGRKKISSAQKTVDQSNSLFSHNPYSEEIGKGITGSAQKKINEGKNEANTYEQMATWLHVGGAILIVVGAGIFIMSFMKKNRR
jgi:hypothetical protein